MIKKLIGYVLIITILLSNTLSVFAQEAAEGYDPNVQEPRTAEEQEEVAKFRRELWALEEKDKQGIQKAAEDLSQTNNSGQVQTGATAAGTTAVDTGQVAQEGLSGCVGGFVSDIIVTQISSYLGDAVSSVTKPQVPTNPVALNNKESTGIAGSGITWDSIGYCVANILIQYITQSTVAWIKGGFQGSPTFIENPEAFFTDIADREAGAFISGLTNGVLCEDFAPRIQLGLLKSQAKTFDQDAKCTLTDVISNIENFSNDFSDGGWAGWLELTQNPQNTPSGAYILAEQKMKDQITIQVESRNKELSWGKGFKPFKECDMVDGKQVNCRTTTPGNIVETQVAQTLGLSKDRLTMADEFDEIVTALVNELIKVALNETLGQNDDEDDD